MGNKVLPYKSQLVKILGRERVLFDREVAALYAHDLSNPPRMIDLMIQRRPGCVVLPSTQEHLVELMKWATAVEVPLTPRAAGTSAYGGAVPARDGVVVDLRHFNRRIDIDKEAGTVTVDPGVVIGDLERALGRAGLMLRVYPTSAPVATIGGFVAQGGVGMGSHQWGPISRQVDEVEVVLPNGDIVTLGGRELEVVTDCEGITGIITRIVLKVAPLEEKVPVLVAYDNAEALVKGVDALRRLNAWNLTFHNPTFSQLREEAGGAKTVPRKKYSILAVFTASQWEAQKEAVDQAVEASGGKRLEDAVAAKDWAEIFNTLRAKKLGPSIAPGEVVFPASALGEFLTRVDREVGYAQVSIEGTLIRGGDVTILAFGLEDERRPEYPVGFALGMKLLDIAKSLGGRAYAPGLYLAAEASRIFGARRLERIADFKKAVDPSGIMNPGKILGIPPRGAPPIVPPMLHVDRQLNSKPAKILMGAMAPLVRYLRPGEERFGRTAQHVALAAVAGGAFGAKHGWSVYTVCNSGYTGVESVLAKAVGHQGGTVLGLMDWAKRYLEGKIEMNAFVAELVAAAAEVEWPGPSQCIFGVDYAQLFKDFRAQIEADWGVTLTVSSTLKARIEAARQAAKAAPDAARPDAADGDDGRDAAQDEEDGQAAAKEAPAAA